MSRIFSGASAMFDRIFKEDPGLKRWTGFLSELDDTFLSMLMLDRENAKTYFKKYVRILEIEPHGYCNRTCHFCPNAMVDRRTDWKLMPEHVFEKILDGLKEIGYDQEVRFARYSEPLAHESIFGKIRAVKTACPGSRVMVISNGDFIEEDTLERLAAVGLGRLHISVYLGSGKQWSVETAQHQIDVLAKRINRKAKLRSVGNDSISQSFENSSFGITCNCVNYGRSGFDRGGAIEGLVDSSYARTAPCMQIFHNFTIDYDGTVMPCCNVRSDIPGQERYAWGKLGAGEGLFEIYGSREAQQWRQSLAFFSEKKAPCLTCKQIVPDEKIESLVKSQWRGRFGN